MVFKVEAVVSKNKEKVNEDQKNSAVSRIIHQIDGIIRIANQLPAGIRGDNDMLDNGPPTTCQDLSEDFETSFHIFDTDGSGQISASKFRQKVTEFDLFPSDHQESNDASYLFS